MTDEKQDSCGLGMPPVVDFYAEPMFGMTTKGPFELTNIHPESACEGQSACPIHKATNHHMRHWQTVWRADRQMLERLCPEHSVGHPDPDQYPYWEKHGMEHMKVHGCCGCCRPQGIKITVPKPE